MTQADVCVVVVSYNTCELTLRCLRALQASRQAGVEIVVVDNASRDGSAEAIAAEFESVRVDKLAENVGWGRAINRAAVGTDADFLLLVNPDTDPVGDVISTLLEFARRHPEHGLYTGRTLTADAVDDGYSCYGLPSVWSLTCFATGLSTVFRRFAWANPERLPRYDRTTVREVPAISGCLMLVDRSLFLRLGGFDPRYFMYSEDIDLCARAAAQGARPVVVPTAAVVHIGGASSAGLSSRLLVLRGKATYLRRHWPARRARVGLSLLAAGVGVRAVASFAVGRRARGWSQAWRERSAWLAGWPPVTEARPAFFSTTAEA